MRKSHLSRRTVLAMIATILGLVAISVAAFGGSGSSSGSGPSQSKNRAIEPVAPIDPDDKDAGRPGKKSSMDPSDPFATSFGAKAKHKVTVRVAANGAANIAVYYRDRKKPKVLSPGSEETRTITARYPLAAVSLQLPGDAPGVATIATCTIVIDDVEVSRVSTRRPWVVKGCIG
jgi:hypothetical protein